MFETMTVGAIHRIYIIYVTFDIKENQKQGKRLKFSIYYIREFVALNMWLVEEGGKH